MSKALTAAILLAGCLSMASCQARGIVQLSVADAQRCYEVMAREDALFSGVVSALDEFAAGAEGSRERLLAARDECRSYLEESGQFVKSLYEKYGLSESDYRLDVFRGRFMPITARERAGGDAAR
jgi:hypothetical protein